MTVDFGGSLCIICDVIVSWLATALEVWKVFWSLIGPAGTVLQWLFHTRENFFLFVKRLEYLLLNRTTWWNASFRFEVPEDEVDNLPALLSRLVDSLRRYSGFQVFVDSAENKTVRAGGVIFQLDCNAGYLHIQISDQQISFRDSRRLIECQLFPLLETIEDSFGQSPRWYSLTARFGSQKNPYLSTHLARVNDRLIISFEYRYNLSESPDAATVSVNTDSVSVTASSRQQFRIAALRILALSRP